MRIQYFWCDTLHQILLTAMVGRPVAAGFREVVVIRDYSLSLVFESMSTRVRLASLRTNFR